MKNKNIELTCIIIGTFIGAGFVSGKEIAVYFSKYGFVSIVYSAIFGILFCFFVNMCLKIGNYTKSCDNTIKTQFGGLYKIVSLIILISSVISIGAMVSGFYSIGNTFGAKFLSISLPILGVVSAAIILVKSFAGLSKINLFIVPILLVLILFITLITCFSSSTLTVQISDMFYSILGGAFSVICYLFFNMFSLGVLLIQIGHKYSKSEICKSSKMSAIIITVILVIINLSIILSNTSIINSNMPLLEEAITINSNFSYIFAICQILGIFTTLVSSAYVAVDLLKIKLSKILSIILVLVLGILVSLLGFETIVGYLYTFTGLLSFIFYIILFYKIKNKKFLFKCN